MNLRTILAKRKPDLAIDLGTANTRMIVRGEGVVFDEPSLCCYENRGSRIRLVAAGRHALAMVGRVPQNHEIRRPLARGVLQDIDAASAVLAHGRTVVLGKKSRFRPSAMIGIPADATKAEANALLIAADHAGFGRVELVREPFAAAVGADLPVREAQASMVIECGAGTTEIAVFSINGHCRSRSVRVGGFGLDEALAEHLHTHHHFLIGALSAEELKKRLSGGGHEERLLEIKGRSVRSGLPGCITLPASEFQPVIERHFTRFAKAAQQVIGEISPDLAADLLCERVVATGGGIFQEFLSDAIAKGCGVPVAVAEDPSGCVARGLGQLLETGVC